MTNTNLRQQIIEILGPRHYSQISEKKIDRLEQLLQSSHQQLLSNLPAKKRFTIAEIFGDNKSHYNAHTSSFREGADYGYNQALAECKKAIKGKL